LHTLTGVRAAEVHAHLMKAARPRAVSADVRAYLGGLRAAATARRFPIVIAAHTILIATASYFALWLRFDGNIPAPVVWAYLQMLPSVLAIRAAAFMGFGLFGGLWRYAGVWDLWRILLATGGSSVVLYLAIYNALGPAVYPRSIVIIESVLLIFFVGGVRLLWRIVPRGVMQSKRRRVLIVGAREGRAMLDREIDKTSP
jgi:FlaA1/EpsC-like NDP-sugar epimerase